VDLRRLSPDERREVDEIRRRCSEPKYAKLLESMVYGLIHSGVPQQKQNDVLVPLFIFLDAVGDEKITPLEPGALRKLKEGVARHLTAEDENLSESAAIILALSGDREYIPQIAALLDAKSAKREGAKGGAAMALGILGAREYAPRLLKMLESESFLIHCGAMLGLGYLGDPAHAERIANAAVNREELESGLGGESDKCAIRALYLIGTDAAAKSVEKLAVALLKEGSVDADYVAFSLAGIGAKRQSESIAKLLRKDYANKGAASLALAILDAQEYAPDIAQLLLSENYFGKERAALALGILNAQTYAPEIVKLLKQEGDTAYYAAISLVLMDARSYANEFLPLLEKYSNENPNGLDLSGQEFHPYVREQYLRIKKRFEERLAAIRADQSRKKTQ
jgi:HEAT repeat protein